MRAAEFINLVFFLFLTVLALLRPLPAGKRKRAAAIGGAGICLIGAALNIGRLLHPLAASVIRDWLPSILLLMVYWQAGQFFIEPWKAFQCWLLRLDQKLMSPWFEWLGDKPGRGWIVCYGELAYFFCYIMVPLGLGVIYLFHMGNYADRFWKAVLPPTYICYVMVPFFQTLPPRVLEPQQKEGRDISRLRLLNLWILRNGSIHANTFPSAHVAASVATALALFPIAPIAASIFLWTAVSIASSSANRFLLPPNSARR